MTFPGSSNSRVVDTYSLVIKFRMFAEVLRRVTEFRAKKREKVIQFPATLQVQTQSGCTSNCLLCPQQKISKIFPQATMDKSLFMKIASEAAHEKNLKSFAFTLQNEPLMDSDLFEKIRYFQSINEYNTIVFIVTNGVLLTKEKTHELLHSGLDMLHISVNGFAKEDFEVINRGRDFETFKTNLEYFLSQDLSKVGLNLSFIMNAKYKDELHKSVKQYQKRGFKTHIHGISNRGGALDDDILKEYSYTSSIDTWRNRILKPLVRTLLPVCPYPFLQGSILANGQMLMCTHDWNRHNIVGDVNTHSIKEIWNGDEINKIRTLMLKGRIKDIPACKKCNVFDDLNFM